MSQRSSVAGYNSGTGSKGASGSPSSPANMGTGSVLQQNTYSPTYVAESSRREENQQEYE
jgi:hypothetical protein